MNLVIIIGAQAVGKMTVGNELSKISDLSLFHNHMSIEFGLKLDSWGTPVFNEVSGGIRELVMNSFIKNQKGMIYTFTWAFDMESDWKEMERIRNKFKDHTIYYVELVTDVNERLKRNCTEIRLNEKPSKRNLEWSNNELINTNKEHRLISNEGEITFENYIRIDNTELTAEQTAEFIKKKFGFQ